MKSKDLRNLQKSTQGNVHIVNGQDIAKKLGNMQRQMCVVGAFSNFFRNKGNQWMKATRSSLRQNLLDLK